MRPRILIVEDSKPDIEDIRLTLTDLWSDDDQYELVEGFGFDETATLDIAETFEEAQVLLNRANKGRRPYDIMFLDLELPRKEHEGLNDEWIGFTLLDLAKRDNSAKEVIICTGHPESVNVLRAFRGGAADFISKDVEPDEKRNRFLGVWQRLLEKEWLRVMDHRIKKLIPYAERHLAHLFSTSFTSLVRSVSHTTEGLRAYAGERYGLDVRDSQDYMIKHLRMQDEAVGTAKREWMERQAVLTNFGEASSPVSVEKALEEISEDIRLCLAAYKIELSFPKSGNTKVLSFNHEVQAMLREIVIGGRAAPAAEMGLSTPSEVRKISVQIESRNRQAALIFTDSLESLTNRDMTSINEGFNFIHDDHYGRAWGLSIVQFIALRGGGRLFIERQRNKDTRQYENKITCFLPLAKR